MIVDVGAGGAVGVATGMARGNGAVGRAIGVSEGFGE